MQPDKQKITNYPYKVELHACGDCGVLPGYEHSRGCDVARCPECGIQRLQCDEHENSSLPAIWTGIWPGVIECIEYDLWSKFVYADDGSLVDYNTIDFENRRPCKWVTTTADDPDASPALNELMRLGQRQLKWSVRLQRYVKTDFNETEGHINGN